VKINSSHAQLFKVFGEFCLYVLNDKEKGIELLQISKRLSHKNILNSQNEPNIETLMNEPVANAIVSNKKSDIGQILNINLLFSVMFGYQKDEIVGKKCDSIMPIIFGEFHQEFMLRFYDSIQDQNLDSKYVGSDQKNYGKNKNGYIFPINYRVSFIEETKYFVSFEAENT
jgi:PAS domain S-box-containing protein